MEETLNNAGRGHRALGDSPFLRGYWDLEDVREFAWTAHAAAVQKDGSRGQLRKYTGEPYIVHPLAVAGLVASIPGVTIEMVAAALLHDVCEDCGVTREEIAERFGEVVASLVDALSDMQTPADGNRTERAARTREKLAAADWRVQSIKLADVVSNLLSVVALDPKFAATYVPEKEALIARLNKGDAGLRAIADSVCRVGRKELVALGLLG